MEIYDRVKLLRKQHLNLSQEKFADKLGTSASVIKNIEYNLLANPNQKEPFYRLICSTFNVRYEWLMKGEGEMLAGADDEVKRVAKQHNFGEYATDLLRLIFTANKAAKLELEVMLEDYVNTCVAKRQTAANVGADIIRPQPTPNTQPTTAAAEPTAQPTQPPTEPPTTAAPTQQSTEPPTTDITNQLLQQMQAQMVAMQERMSKQEERHATEIAEIKQQNAAKDNKIAKLTSENAEQAKIINKLQADRITQLEEQAKKTTAEQNALRKETAQLNKSTKQLNTENNALEKDIQQLLQEEEMQEILDNIGEVA